jgi:HAD superfamily hydrolase (TIGR01509 family)
MTTALLFDLDGTLVDTDHLHFEAMGQVLAGHGVALDLPTYKARIMGANNKQIAADFLPHLTAGESAAELARKEAIYRSLVTVLTPMAGAEALLDFAQEAGLGTAVVTNAPRQNAELVLKGLGLARRFATLVIADELEHAKPHPMPYLRGLELTGGVAGRSVAFEDSASGIRAAVDAGIPVIGIMSGHSEERLLSLGAVMAVKDFTDPRVMAFVQAQRG